jgi:UDP-N-acetylglucosamine:LPS N-acetylglucosamine transferase
MEGHRAIRKIVVFSTRGGGAHGAAVSALESYLGGAYQLRVVNFFERFVQPLEPFWAMSFRRISREDFYNFCLRWGWHRTANHLVARHARPWFLRMAPKLEAGVVPFLEEERPDLVISVIPFVNAILTSTLRPRGVPLLLLPVDLDTTNYILGLADQPYDRLRVVLPFDDLEIRRRISPVGIPRRQVRVLGFPVRPGFLQDGEPERLRKELELPLDRPVVMLLMGGAGASTLRGFVRELGRSERSMHLVACVGRNEELGRRLGALKLNGRVSLSVMGFTDRVADLMAASDLLISKPGPATINEAIYTNLPMLLDASASILSWEKLNLDLIREHELGEILESRREVRVSVERLLGDSAYRARIRANLESFPKHDFGAAIEGLLKELLTPTSIE